MRRRRGSERENGEMVMRKEFVFSIADLISFRGEATDE